MIREDFHVEPANWETDFADLRHVREQVFIVEQNVPAEEEWDALDAKSYHVIARDAQGRPIGTGRLTPEHTLGRMAVVAHWRGKQVGQAIMRVLLEQARALRYPVVELHAQIHAMPLYAKFGFQPYGETFHECNILHQSMRLLLPVNELERPTAALNALPEACVLSVNNLEQAHAAVLALLKAAHHEIAIYSRDLDAGLYDQVQIMEEIKRIALSGRNARVRIIVQEPAKAVAEGHRLIELAHRLPSLIAIRTPIEEEDLNYPSAFLLNDQRGYLLRTLNYRHEAEGNMYDPGQHRQLITYFNSVWERSEPSQELRQLTL